MADERPQPPTTKIEAVTDRKMLEELTRAVKEGFANLQTDIQLVATDLSVVKERVRIIERRQDESDERGKKHSGGLARGSDVDARHDAAISTLIVDVAHLKETQSTQLAILRRLDAVAANPMVRKVAYAVGGAILSYLALKGYLPR